MEDCVFSVLEEERRKRNIALDVKFLNGNYYPYNSTSKYDREIYGPKKVSEYIGKIMENGARESQHPQKTVHKYENSSFEYSLSGDLLPALMRYLPDRWESIYAPLMVRLLDRITPEISEGEVGETPNDF
jgi:hypothetical protein